MSIYSKKIDLKAVSRIDTVEEFEKSLADLTLGEKIFQCQSLNEKNDEASFAKLLILYLKGEAEIKSEIKRIINWSYQVEKVHFFIKQLNSNDTDITYNSIKLIGLLKEPIALPYLNDIFDLEDTQVCQHIIRAIGEIGHPDGSKIVKKAVETPEKNLLILAIKTLSAWIDDVHWKTFKPLLRHKDRDVRVEAAFSISLRKNRKSAASLLKALNSEADSNVKYSLIQFLGLIPSKILLLPLLNIIIHDDDQKARLISSKTLDRLQGILKPQILFKYRSIKDISIRAEVIFRLGKFGTDNEKNKKYLRHTLEKTEDDSIKQSCLQALGYIADHNDIQLLTRFINIDPLSGYNAVIGLTRVWRLEDKDQIYSILEDNLLPIQKQIILKYLIRRRGAGADPVTILNIVKKLLEGEENLSVRYLALSLLEFAPINDTVSYLIDVYASTENSFDIEVIGHVLSYLTLHYTDTILAFVKSCDENTCEYITKFIPTDLSIEFIRSLSTIIVEKFSDIVKGAESKPVCDDLCRIFMSRPEVTKEFLRSLSSVEWKRFFLKKLLSHATLNLVTSIQSDLIEMLKVNDKDVRNTIMQLLIPIKDTSSLPNLMAIAESEGQNEAGEIAKNLIRHFVEEGYL